MAIYKSKTFARKVKKLRKQSSRKLLSVFEAESEEQISRDGIEKEAGN